MVQETRNNIKKTYVYEPHSFKPVALIQDEQIYHYHLDHLGTPRELTNDTGDIVWKVRYKTYGNVAVKEVDEIENNIRFQGQYFDEESGLHYNRHRYYNPSSGQFISQDPIGLLGGVNNYQYAPNPTGWVDPLGLCKDQERITNARLRQQKILENNEGFNISPTKWDAYPTIGRGGTFISDSESVTDVIGEFEQGTAITLDKQKIIELETAFGLEPDSLKDGFKVRMVSDINSQSPRSPLEGNRFFKGSGNHLPGGAPEMVIDSIPTTDNKITKTILEVKPK